MNQQFGDFMYQRPDLSVLKDELRHLTKRFAAASSAAVQGELLHEINQQRNEFASMASLAHIRHTINTKDPYYAAEQDYFDEVEPLYNELNTEYYRTLVSSSFKKELSLRFGQQLFSIAEMTLQTFSPAVIAELQQENKLVSRYKQLLASASIPFAGAERNLSQLVPYQQSVDRGTRQ
ncbi:MAG: M3 family oligoendopeptidase, partial [Firmicutes bacterium]|nr:M3 family oligoendopeptidase [Bacillota bacterium]